MNFTSRYQELCDRILGTVPFHTGSWQSTSTHGSPAHATYELQDEIFVIPVPYTMDKLQQDIQPNLPWAELHFQERVGGVPVNPPSSHTQWPWAHHNGQFQQPSGKFSHSYPERMWPKYAGRDWEEAERGQSPNRGIRYHLGDLGDMVDLLIRQPLTRQAYLPIWFPEDTGTHHGQRVPCSLGYHFMIRDHVLSCRYYMRSCDLIRHFSDDLYMACRLMQWVAASVSWAWKQKPLSLGEMKMYISSLHAFVGDSHSLRRIVNGTNHSA